MTAYASRTGTQRNLAALAAAGWRLLLSPTGVLRTEGFPYALDSGAWTAHQRGEPFNEQRYVDAVRKFGMRADWVALPDIVCGGLLSLGVSLLWLCRLKRLAVTRWLIPVQDGMTSADIAPHLSRTVGIFIGGSTRFKEDTAPEWGRLARERGCYLHMGRVNTARRIALCAAVGVDSFDGTSVSRFAVTLPELERARRFGVDQGRLFYA